MRPNIVLGDLIWPEIRVSVAQRFLFGRQPQKVKVTRRYATFPVLTWVAIKVNTNKNQYLIPPKSVTQTLTRLFPQFVFLHVTYGDSVNTSARAKDGQRLEFLKTAADRFQPRRKKSKICKVGTVYKNKESELKTKAQSRLHLAQARFLFIDSAKRK